MAKEETIVKRQQRVDKKTRKKVIEDITYRIDASFVPEKVSDICMEFIINYCKANGAEAITWLKDIANKEELQERTSTDKNTGEKITKTVKVHTPFVIARKILCKVPKSDKVFVSPGRLARAVSYSEISILSPK